MLYYIDIVDACNLRCPTCIRGRRELENTSSRMSLNKFKNILAKAKDNGAKTIALYNWTEPFLHPQLPDFVDEIKGQGLSCILSSNLSLKRIPRLEDTLKAGPSSFQVSISGFTNEIHTINHKGGDIRIVKEHLLQISKMLPGIDHNIKVTVKYLVFDYNRSQIDDFKYFVENIGLEFMTHPGMGNPQEKQEKQEKHGLKTINGHLTIDSVGLDACENTFLCPCEFLFDQMVLNHFGEVFLCCVFEASNLYKIGDFCKMPYPAVMLSRLFHPQCRTCVFARRKYTDIDMANLNLWFSDLPSFIESPIKSDLPSFWESPINSDLPSFWKSPINSDLPSFWEKPINNVVQQINYGGDIKEIVHYRKRIELVSTGGNPFFMIPDTYTFESGALYIMQIEIKAPVKTTLQLFYKNSNEEFSEKKSIFHPLKVGENNILLYLNDVSGKTNFRLDPGNHPGKYVITAYYVYKSHPIEYSSDIKEIVHYRERIELVSTGGDPFFMIPDTHTFENGELYIVQIEIKAPVETTLQLFYKELDEVFSEKKSKCHPLKAGENNILLFLDDVSGKTNLRLDPGNHPGQYVITKFDVYKFI